MSKKIILTLTFLLSNTSEASDNLEIHRQYIHQHNSQRLSTLVFSDARLRSQEKQTLESILLEFSKKNDLNSLEFLLGDSCRSISSYLSLTENIPLFLFKAASEDSKDVAQFLIEKKFDFLTAQNISTALWASLHEEKELTFSKICQTLKETPNAPCPRVAELQQLKAVVSKNSMRDSLDKLIEFKSFAF